MPCACLCHSPGCTVIMDNGEPCCEDWTGMPAPRQPLPRLDHGQPEPKRIVPVCPKVYERRPEPDSS